LFEFADSYFSWDSGNMPSVSDEKRLYQRIKILSDAFMMSARALDYKAVLRAATRHFQIFTEADASVLFLNTRDDSLTPVCSSGIPFSKIKGVVLPRSLRLKDIVTHPVLDLRYTSFMNTPLIYNRKLIGLSAVFSIVPEKFHGLEHDKYENLFLTMLASYLAVSIENATLMDTIKSIESSKFDWESTFDALDDLISIHDKDFTILRANKAVARKFKMDIRQIVGEKCYKIFHCAEEPWKTCPHRRTMETMAPCTEMIDDQHMGGAFHVTTFPHVDVRGKFVGSIHVAKEIIGQKDILEQLIRPSHGTVAIS
jgi:PAS domain-containing protein